MLNRQFPGLRNHEHIFFLQKKSREWAKIVRKYSISVENVRASDLKISSGRFFPSDSGDRVYHEGLEFGARS